MTKGKNLFPCKNKYDFEYCKKGTSTYEVYELNRSDADFSTFLVVF